MFSNKVALLNKFKGKQGIVHMTTTLVPNQVNTTNPLVFIDVIGVVPSEYDDQVEYLYVCFVIAHMEHVIWGN